MSALQTPFRTPHPALAAPSRDDHPFPPFVTAITLPRKTRIPGATLTESLGIDRIPVEALIRTRFATAYEARIARFMPRLFSLQQPGERPLGAFGLREARRESLFLESYLDQPIEQTIAGQLGQAVSRDAIVEVGQFAGSGAGAFRSLILHLTERLHRDGHHWVVFTGTNALRNAFSRLGLQPRELGIADPMRLGADERANWGSYYEHAPRVMFGDIREGFAAISASLTAGDAA